MATAITSANIDQNIKRRRRPEDIKRYKRAGLSFIALMTIFGSVALWATPHVFHLIR